jgi:hypothetical protein
MINTFIDIFRILLFPIFLCIWLIEDIVRARKKDNKWQINSYQVSFIFIFLSYVGGHLILFTNSIWTKFLGIYILSTMEILSLALSFIVGFGKSTTFHSTIQRIGTRKREILLNTRTNEGIYRVIVTYIYNIYYFGSLYSLLYWFNPNSFDLPNSTFDFYYYSALVLTLFNSPFNPSSIGAKLMTIVQVFTGMLFIVFIFSSIVSYHVNSSDKRD